jgi:hypothetical protein
MGLFEEKYRSILIARGNLLENSRRREDIFYWKMQYRYGSGGVIKTIGFVQA